MISNMSIGLKLLKYTNNQFTYDLKQLNLHPI